VTGADLPVLAGRQRAKGESTLTQTIATSTPPVPANAPAMSTQPKNQNAHLQTNPIINIANTITNGTAAEVTMTITIAAGVTTTNIIPTTNMETITTTTTTIATALITVITTAAIVLTTSATNMTSCLPSPLTHPCRKKVSTSC